MPLASSRGNGRLSTPSAPASVSASLPSPTNPATPGAASGASSPNPPATANTATSSASSSSALIASKSPSSSASSSRPGFLSRLGIPLSLPLRSRNRNVTDFHVRCDEPYRKYNAGEHVRGAVVLVVVKPLRITHLVVTLHGFVRVLKDPAAVAKVQGTTTLPQGGSSSRPQYHGNGYASLFQDEQVLSGEGRLEPGKYEFGFDLVFPDKGLPSSIDFERGTISYMITATLTRPISIAPTISCDRKVMLAERMDVGLLPPPRPRTIFLEPISKRTRKKKSTMALEKGSAVASEAMDVTSEAGSLEPSITTEDSVRDGHAADQRGHLHIDIQSEVSGESGRSISTVLSRSELPQLSQVGTAFTSAQQQAVDDKTITATIELMKGGCLPGDTVSVRVSVQHVKLVKSITGVIVTLFRQGKIDFAPPSGLFKNMMTKEDARRIQKEDIYPKSRTGLGGLSLSSGGNSISMFRKDLDQATAPLMINPDTLQAAVTVPVKLPDDSFPTIKGVPGDMISFKYQVEVIVDLGGRLSGQFPSGQSRYGPFSASASEQNMGNIFSTRRGAEIVDTSQLRRQKGVICVSIESVVGTVDSSGGRRHIRPSPSPRTLDVAESDDDECFLPTPTRYEEACHHVNELPPQNYYPPQANSQQYYAPPFGQSHPPEPSRPNYSHPNNYSHGPTPMYMPPPPQLPDEHNMSEKDRIRQAETRLLPSQPPAASPSGPAPSAPDDDDIYDAQPTPRPIYPAAGNAAHEDEAGPSAPTAEELSAGIAAAAGPREDKQELERRRLMQEASAPPEFPEDMETRNRGGRAPRRDEAVPEVEPSAPVLDDDDYPGYGPGVGPSGGGSGSGSGHNHDGEQLPAYQR